MLVRVDGQLAFRNYFQKWWIDENGARNARRWHCRVPSEINKENRVPESPELEPAILK